jgi:hypothetical protein
LHAHKNSLQISITQRRKVGSGGEAVSFEGRFVLRENRFDFMEPVAGGLVSLGSEDNAQQKTGKHTNGSSSRRWVKIHGVGPVVVILVEKGESSSVDLLDVFT